MKVQKTPKCHAVSDGMAAQKFGHTIRTQHEISTECKYRCVLDISSIQHLKTCKRKSESVTRLTVRAKAEAAQNAPEAGSAQPALTNMRRKNCTTLKRSNACALPLPKLAPTCRPVPGHQLHLHCCLRSNSFLHLHTVAFLWTDQSVASSPALCCIKDSAIKSKLWLQAEWILVRSVICSCTAAHHQDAARAAAND